MITLPAEDAENSVVVGTESDVLAKDPAVAEVNADCSALVLAVRGPSFKVDASMYLKFSVVSAFPYMDFVESSSVLAPNAGALSSLGQKIPSVASPHQISSEKVLEFSQKSEQRHGQYM